MYSSFLTCCGTTISTTYLLGQCGNQIGSAFWPLVLREYGVHRQGKATCAQGPGPALQDAIHSFFHVPEGSSGQLDTLADLARAGATARAVCVDMEDSVVGRFSHGPLRRVFDADCLVTNYPGSGNNWAEGFHEHGRRYRDRLLEVVRRAAERCDHLHGFLLLFSLGGGTGSGLGSRLLALLHNNFPRIDRLVTCVYPAGCEDVVTAPYNVALANRELLRHASCVFPVHNKALLDMCEHLRTGCESAETSRYMATCKPFHDMNNIVVNMLLHLTSAACDDGRGRICLQWIPLPGPLNVDISDIATNMVPFPGLHFVSSSFSPVVLGRRNHESSVRKDLCAGVLSRHNQLVGLDPWGGVLLGTALVGRGSVSMADMRGYVNRLSMRRRFAPWGMAVKVGVCSVPAAGHPASLLALANSSNMASLFSDVASQFTKLYRRKAHTHHYLKVEGFDASDFEDSRECLLESVSRYRGMEHIQKASKPRLRAVV